MTQQLDIESRVLSGLLSKPEVFPTLQITKDDFIDQNNRMIFTAISESGDGTLDSVARILENKTQRAWLPDLVDIAVTGAGANCHAWADVLRDMTMRRKAMRVCQTMLEALHKGEENAVERGMAELGNTLNTTREVTYTLSTAAESAIATIERKIAGEETIGTGIEKIDKEIGGFRGGDLVVIGARPGVGKTSMMMQMAVSSARAGIPIGVFSGEQPAEQLAERVMAATSHISLSDMRRGDCDVDKLRAAASRFKDYQMHISDASAPSLSHINKIARQWQRDHGIKAIFVDYLQRMKGDHALPKTERVGELIKGLKSLAKDTRLPVICLSQLNRNTANENRLPRMSDLRDTGEIEQEADQIFLLHTDCSDQNANCADAMIVLDKNRHGPVCTFKLKWFPRRMLFAEPAK